MITVVLYFQCQHHPYITSRLIKLRVHVVIGQTKLKTRQIYKSFSDLFVHMLINANQMKITKCIHSMADLNLATITELYKRWC